MQIKTTMREFPVVQGLGLCASTAEVLGSIPGQGTKIPQTVWYDQKKKNKKQTKNPHLLEWLLSKRQEITIKGKDVEKRETVCTIGGNVSWSSHYRKQYGGSSKN